MSTAQMLPVWMQVNGVAVNGTSMGASITTDAVKMEWEDNAGIHVKWTGTPTGTLSVEVNLDPDNLDWQAITFTPTPDQPGGSSGGDFFDVYGTAAAWIRLKYTRVSGTGALYAKIALKSV